MELEIFALGQSGSSVLLGAPCRRCVESFSGRRSNTFTHFD